MAFSSLFIGRDKFPKIAVFMCFDDIKIESKFIHCSLHIWEKAENADGAGNSGWLRYDFGGIAWNVISSRGCPDRPLKQQRFFFFQVGYGFPYLFRCISASTPLNLREKRLRLMLSSFRSFSISLTMNLSWISDEPFPIRYFPRAYKRAMLFSIFLLLGGGTDFISRTVATEFCLPYRYWRSVRK